MLLAPHTHAAVESRVPLHTRPEHSFTRPTSSTSSTPSTPSTPSTLFPPVDEHIVQPEVTYDEIIRGRKVSAMTALFPHAKAQNDLAFLIAPHVKPGYDALTELLTRAAVGSDFGTDVCVCKSGIDPTTKSRYLEEISFEVVNEQKMRDITEKAEDLIHRGVRRVFGIFVKTGEVCEWSKAENEFVPLNKDGFIEDPLFVRSIAVKALVDFALSEDEVARALIVKNNSAIVAFKQDAHKRGVDEGRKLGVDEGRKLGVDEGRKLGVDEGRKLGVDEGRKLGVDEGVLKGRREALIDQLGERFGEIPTDVSARIHAADIAQLRDWSKKMFTVASMDGVFAADPR